MKSLLRTGLLVVVFVAEVHAESPLELDAVLTLFEDVRIPARDAGPLVELLVQPGHEVEPGAVIGRLDDKRAKLVREQARLEWVNAERLAKNELELLLARKTREVAEAEHKRALESAARFEKSVSQTELDRLRLETEQSELQVQQTQFNQETAGLAVRAKQTAYHLTEHDLTNRTILAPGPGMVVEVLKQVGEWVEPGEPVVRLVRMDRLRVEAFLSADKAHRHLVGRTASVTVKNADGMEVTLDAQVTFVSPEVHPVNGTVRIWAEIDNRDLALRPGLPAKLSIQP